jgi:hypothetical protein
MLSETAFLSRTSKVRYVLLSVLKVLFSSTIRSSRLPQRIIL